MTSTNNSNMTADFVVYGKIYTSKITGDYAETFAVKDGKYIYVGDEGGVNGTLEGVECDRMAEDEYLTVEEMLDVFTINGAKQFGFEDKRGSIEVGKYADFMFLDKDITTCPKNEIHKGKVDTVYFEGKQVLSTK